MKVFVARQPILDREQKIIAYELLYRKDSLFNEYDHTNGDQATADVIINTFFNIGPCDAFDNRKCFINFTENLLKLGIASYFPSDQIVIEILENVEPTDDVIEIIKELKRKGYTIVLDDVIYNQPFITSRFFPYIDIVKVDFQSTTEEIRNKIIRECKQWDIKILAEKIETLDEYKIAFNEGFHYFQGYYFSKPKILSSYDIPENFQSCHLILSELKNPNPNVSKIAKIIETDVSLSYKLLKMVNSPLYGTSHKIKSIQQAIMLLGFNEMEKWIFVLTIRDLKHQSHIHQDLMQMSLIRAKFCELYASKFGNEQNKSSYFITGLFSLIDTLLHRKMDDILKELPLEEDIKDALLNGKNEYSIPLNIIKHMERADWDKISCDLENPYKWEEELSSIYVDAIQWTNQIFSNRFLKDLKWRSFFTAF